MSGPTGTPTPSDNAAAFARSAVYQALAIAFGPPDRCIASRRGWRRLGIALEELGLDRPKGPRVAAWARLHERHAELFGHTARGRVSPYETEYGSAGSLFLASHELADIAAFLTAFGLRLDDRMRERVDHIRVECEFMAFLTRKEIHAGEVGSGDMLEATRNAQRLFLRDHLGRFAPALGEQLATHDHGAFYGAVGSVLRRFVEAECARLAVPAGKADLALRVVVDDGAPSACGGCDQAGCPA